MREYASKAQQPALRPVATSLQPKGTSSREPLVLQMQRQRGNRAVARILCQSVGHGEAPAHEAIPEKSSPPAVAAKASKTQGIELTFVTIKRKNISLKGEDKYGHWWTEIDGESYGWWPKNPVGLTETLFGTQGELNGMTSFGGSPTRDPHHGDSADEQFHPTLAAAGKTEDQVKKDVRGFASAYRGEWRWTLGWGQNCRTFQIGLMESVGLKEP